MDAMAIAMIVSAASDAIITVAAKVNNEDPEELKKKIEALQVKADDLEIWLKGDKME